MRFRVLGPMHVEVDGREISITASRDRALLATLLLNANEFVHTDHLVDAIWDTNPPHYARNQLQGCVSRLRKRLGNAVILTEPAGYRIVVGPDKVDLLEFRRLVARARTEAGTGQYDTAGASYRAALRLWRGPAMAGFESHELRQAAAALAEEQAQVLQECIEAELGAGAGAGLVAELAVLARQHPHREGMHRALMLALYRAGRQADALAAYRHARQLLNDELGTEPGTELQQLHHAILNRDRALDAQPTQARPPAPSLAPKPRELPPDVAGFTGRADALKKLDELLPDGAATPGPVVITAIAGTAGVGKTALAVHWAHNVAERFPDGQLYINLRGYTPGAGPLRSVEALSMLLRSLGLPSEQIPVEEAEASTRYRSMLADLNMLVVLDNARSVEQIRPLLPGSPGCLVLITSRDRLTGLVARDGARRITLDVLTPNEAYALLTRLLGHDRVAAEPDAVADLAKVCAYLPLGLRIAAAQLDGHPDRRIGSLVRDLTTGNRLTTLDVADDPETALRTTFDLSYRIIPGAAQRLFRLLGLVPGPTFTTDAAAALMDLPLEETRQVLDRLRTAHLIHKPAGNRYALHDLLRLYAAECADREETGKNRTAAITRLFNWYLTMADAASRIIGSDWARLPLPPDVPQGIHEFPTERDAVSFVEMERANLVAAVQHAAENGPKRYAWLLADRLRAYLMRQVGVDGLTIGRAALTAAEIDGGTHEQAAAHLALADARFLLNDNRQAAAHYSKATDLARLSHWPQGQAAAENNLGVAYLDDARLADAARHLARAHELNQQMGRLAFRASNLGNLGFVRFLMGDLLAAEELWTEAQAQLRDAGDLRGEAISHANLGNADWLLGRLGTAQERLVQAIRLLDEIGDRIGKVYAMRVLACVLCDAGQRIEALRYATDAVASVRGDGAITEEAHAHNALASVYCQLRRYRDATEHHERARTIGPVQPLPECQALLGLALTQLRQGRPDAALEHALPALQRTRDVGYRVFEGQALTILAEIKLNQGESDQAMVYARQALENHRCTGHRLGEAKTLTVLGRLASAGGEARSAILYRRAARELFEDIGAPLPAEAAEDLRT
jgi:DNA-binding SARP family transcriptional activator